MRPRFSLRTLFIITTLIAVACYWFVLPSLTARRFAAAVAGREYHAADGYFSNDGDRFLTDWNDKHWAFQPRADLLPLTAAQLIQGKRQVHIEIRYFELDQHVHCNVQIAASPLGLSTLNVSPKLRSSITIDGNGSGLPTPRVR